jgi:hypothetical protein
MRMKILTCQTSIHGNEDSSFAWSVPWSLLWALGAIPSPFGFTGQPHTHKMKPFNRTVFIITSYHFTKWHLITQAVGWFIWSNWLGVKVRLRYDHTRRDEWGGWCTLVFTSTSWCPSGSVVFLWFGLFPSFGWFYSRRCVGCRGNRRGFAECAPIIGECIILHLLLWYCVSGPLVLMP